MTGIDEELEQRFRRGTQPVRIPPIDPLIRRASRASRTRRIGRATLAAVTVLVIAGTSLWARTMVGTDATTTIGPAPQPPSPLPIVAAANGLIAFGDGDGLFTLDPRSGRVTAIHDVPEHVWSSVWSPDGNEIAITVRRYPTDPTQQTVRSELWILASDGKDQRLVATAESIGRPSWSPDGTSIAYVASSTEGSSIHIVSADGQADRVVGDVIPHGQHSYFSASFSPDGTELLFDKGTDVGFGIFVMGANGGNVRQLSAGTSDYNPSWSPDGRSIVFTRQEEAMKSDIFVMNADGSNVQRLTHGGATDTYLDGTFSPDGRQIAYISGKQGGPGGIVVMRSDGSSPKTLVDDGVLGIGWQPVPTSNLS